MPERTGLISVRSLRGRVRPIDFTEMVVRKNGKEIKKDTTNNETKPKTENDP